MKSRKSKLFVVLCGTFTILACLVFCLTNCNAANTNYSNVTNYALPTKVENAAVNNVQSNTESANSALSTKVESLTDNNAQSNSEDVKAAEQTLPNKLNQLSNYRSTNAVPADKVIGNGIQVAEKSTLEHNAQLLANGINPWNPLNEADVCWTIEDATLKLAKAGTHADWKQFDSGSAVGVPAWHEYQSQYTKVAFEKAPEGEAFAPSKTAFWFCSAAQDATKSATPSLITSFEGLENLDMQYVKDAQFMFASCINANTQDDNIPVNMDNIENAYAIFSFCGFSNNALSNACNSFKSVTNVSFSFGNCPNIETADVNNVPFTKIANVTCMFINDKNLKTISNLQNVVIGKDLTDGKANADCMFYGCENLDNPTVQNLVGKKVSGIGGLFQGCKNIKTLDISDWNTSGLSFAPQVFMDCTNLRTLYGQNWSDNVTTDISNNIFKNCFNLTGGNGFKYSSEDPDCAQIVYAKYDKNGQKGYQTYKDPQDTTNWVKLKYSVADEPYQNFVQTVAKGDSFTVQGSSALKDPEAPAYTSFAGWSETEGSTTAQYKKGAAVNTSDREAGITITLYPVFVGSKVTYVGATDYSSEFDKVNSDKILSVRKGEVKNFEFDNYTIGEYKSDTFIIKFLKGGCQPTSETDILTYLRGDYYGWGDIYNEGDNPKGSKGIDKIWNWDKWNQFSNGAHVNVNIDRSSTDDTIMINIALTDIYTGETWKEWYKTIACFHEVVDIYTTVDRSYQVFNSVVTKTLTLNTNGVYIPKEDVPALWIRDAQDSSKFTTDVKLGAAYNAYVDIWKAPIQKHLTQEKVFNGFDYNHPGPIDAKFNDWTATALVDSELTPDVLIGATDYTSEYASTHSTPITLNKNTSKTIKFTNYTNVTNQFVQKWNNFSMRINKGVDFTTNIYTNLRADCIAIDAEGEDRTVKKETNLPTHKDEFSKILDGASVSAVVSYQETNINVIFKVDSLYRKTDQLGNSWFVKYTKPNITDDKVYLFMTVDNSYLVLNNSQTYDVSVNLNGGKVYIGGPEGWAKDPKNPSVYKRSFNKYASYSSLLRMWDGKLQRKGYSFLNWDPQPGFNTVTADCGFTAQWSQQHIVTMDLQGGSVIKAPEGWNFTDGQFHKSFLAGTSISEITNAWTADGVFLYKDGFEHDGFGPSSGTISDDTTITVKWTESQNPAHKLTFDSEDGRIITDKIITSSNVHEGPAFPFCNEWKYGKNETIYTKKEIGGAGTINCLSYNVAVANETPSDNIIIYMGLTDKNYFDSPRDYLPLDQLTKVYESKRTIGKNTGWENYQLDTPFEYDGNSNLVVVAIRDGGTQQLNLKYKAYYSSEDFRNIRYYGRFDDEREKIIDPCDWTSDTAFVESWSPVIKISFQSKTQNMWSKNNDSNKLYTNPYCSQQGPMPVPLFKYKELLGYWNGTDDNASQVLDKDGNFVGAVAGYTDGTNWTTTENKTLYARFQDKKCFVEYDGNGRGSPIPEPIIVKSGTKLTKPIEPTEPYCYFKGWFKQQSCIDEWDFDNDIVEDNMTLYAKWEDTRTVKAVYSESAGVYALIFYYDTISHEDEGKVYPITNFAPSQASDWPYDRIREQVNIVHIDNTMEKFDGFTKLAWMCGEMTNVSNVSGFNHLKTNNVTDFSYMFSAVGQNSTNFNNVPDVSNWNTTNVKTANNMFSYYANRSENISKAPDVSNWDTSLLADIGSMFAYYGISSNYAIEPPDISSKVKNVWSVSNLENAMEAFFNFGSKYTTSFPNFSNWNTSKLKNVVNMLSNYGGNYSSTCSAKVREATLDLTSFNTSNIEKYSNMLSAGSNNHLVGTITIGSGWTLNLANCGLQHRADVEGWWKVEEPSQTTAYTEDEILSKGAGTYTVYKQHSAWNFRPKV